MVRFSVIARQDHKIGLFSPEAKQALVIEQGTYKQIVIDMIGKGYPEALPDRVLEGLGLEFGEMSLTAWNTMIALCRKYEPNNEVF